MLNSHELLIKGAVQTIIIPVFPMFSQLYIIVNNETNNLFCLMLTSFGEERPGKSAEQAKHYIIMNYEL